MDQRPRSGLRFNIGINLEQVPEEPAPEPEERPPAPEPRAWYNIGWQQARQRAAPKGRPAARAPAAAAELRQAGARRTGPPITVQGPLPPEASSTGRVYYCFRSSLPGGPAVIAGQEVALRLLGGSWIAHGTAPSGHATFEDAANRLIDVEPDLGDISVVWR